MIRTPIDRFVAKTTLAKIDQKLASPHLVIGGLAVQQYYHARDSKDIDLICDHKTLLHILKELFPGKEWKIEYSGDEYRPSIAISHKFRPEEHGTVYLGPKIQQRGGYNYLEWNDLLTDARPFKFDGKELKNIVVPAAYALAYSKFISFIGRVDNNLEKGKQDLQDFAELTNCSEFSSERFYGLICKNANHRAIVDEFRERIQGHEDIIRGSHLQDLAFLFPDPVWSLDQIEDDDDKLSVKTEYDLTGFWRSEWIYGTDKCEDLLEIKVLGRKIVGRRVAKTGHYLHSYKVSGFTYNDCLYFLAQNISGKPIGVSVALQTSDNFGDRLEGLTIRPAGNEPPRPPMDEVLFSDRNKFWASKVEYKRLEGRPDGELWNILRECPFT